MIRRTVLSLGLLAVALAAGAAAGADESWPQFQQNAQRHGRLEAAPEAPYRARWIWCGPKTTLRNRNSNPNWQENLDPPSVPLPQSVPMTFADGMQPVHRDGVIYALDQEGQAYAIAMADGSTKWVGQNPGGSMNSPAIAQDVLVCASMSGRVTALKLADGTEAWHVETGRAISGSPALLDGTVYVANHGGWVYAIDSATGDVQWKQHLSSPSIGGICADENGVYLGVEDMTFHALDRATGEVRAQHKLIGQSYRMLWPMVYDGQLYVQTNGAICNGSEGVLDDVLASGENPEQEYDNLMRWLAGDNNGGKWRWGGPDWRHFFVMKTADLSEPFIVPNGPIEGCGTPAEPPVVDNEGRVLLWWRTKFPTFTAPQGGFGTRFGLDISAVDPATGRRVPIDNGKFCGQYPLETDNLFGLTVGADTIFLRQRFRGTHGLHLKRSEHYFIQAESRSRDGGNWPGDVTYVAQDSARVSTPTSAASTRTGPAVAPDLLIFAERYCITVMEHKR